MVRPEFRPISQQSGCPAKFNAAWLRLSQRSLLDLPPSAVCGSDISAVLLLESFLQQVKPAVSALPTLDTNLS